MPAARPEGERDRHVSGPTDPANASSATTGLCSRAIPSGARPARTTTGGRHDARAGAGTERRSTRARPARRGEGKASPSEKFPTREDGDGERGREPEPRAEEAERGGERGERGGEPRRPEGEEGRGESGDHAGHGRGGRGVRRK